MSVEIHIETLTGNPHPTWDYGINGGHKQFVREILHTLPHVYRQVGEDPWRDGVLQYYRPTDFTAWRAAVVSLPNKNLFEEMIDILEQDENYWIYVSQ